MSFIFGSVSYFIAAALAVCAVVTAVIYSNEINNETGRTKLKEFYYLNIKNTGMYMILRALNVI